MLLGPVPGPRVCFDYLGGMWHVTTRSSMGTETEITTRAKFDTQRWQRAAAARMTNHHHHTRHATTIPSRRYARLARKHSSTLLGGAQKSPRDPSPRLAPSPGRPRPSRTPPRPYGRTASPRTAHLRPQHVYPTPATCPTQPAREATSPQPGTQAYAPSATQRSDGATHTHYSTRRGNTPTSLLLHLKKTEHASANS